MMKVDTLLRSVFALCCLTVAVEASAEAAISLQKDWVALAATSCRGTHEQQQTAVEGYIAEQVENLTCPLGDPPPGCIEVMVLAGIDYSKCGADAACCIIEGQVNCFWECASSAALTKSQLTEKPHPKFINE